MCASPPAAFAAPAIRPTAAIAERVSFLNISQCPFLFGFAVMGIEVVFNGCRLRQRLLGYTQQRQDHQEVSEPISRADQRYGRVRRLSRHCATPHQYDEVDCQKPDPPLEAWAVFARAN